MQKSNNCTKYAEEKSLLCPKVYVSCILPILEYGSSSWSPTSQKQVNALEMVHHNAAKFVANKYPKKGQYDQFSISKVISNLEWKSLEERRNHAGLIIAYKILNGHVIQLNYYH